MRRVRMGRRGAVAGLLLLGLVVAGALQAAVGRRDGPAASVSRTSTMGPALAPAADSGAANSGASSSAAAVSPGGIEKQIAPVPPSPGGTAVVPGSPKVVRTADLRVKVAKGGFGSAFDRVASIASANGGFVTSSTSSTSSSSSTSADGPARSGDLTVRVPADRFDAARQALSGLGTVDSQAIRGEDVSGQLVDYDARLKSLQAQEAALLSLVGQAKAVGDVLQVQSSLFSVRQQVEQLTAQRANLDQSANLSTIHVSLFEPGAVALSPKPIDERSLAHSARQAVDGMLAVAGGMLVVVGWLVPVAVLGGLAWGGLRVFRRRPAPVSVN